MLSEGLKKMIDMPEKANSFHFENGEFILEVNSGYFSF